MGDGHTREGSRYLDYRKEIENIPVSKKPEPSQIEEQSTELLSKSEVDENDTVEDVAVSSPLCSDDLPKLILRVGDREWDFGMDSSSIKSELDRLRNDISYLEKVYNKSNTEITSILQRLEKCEFSLTKISSSLSKISDKMSGAQENSWDRLFKIAENKKELEKLKKGFIVFIVFFILFIFYNVF